MVPALAAGVVGPEVEKTGLSFVDNAWSKLPLEYGIWWDCGSDVICLY